MDTAPETNEHSTDTDTPEGATGNETGDLAEAAGAEADATAAAVGAPDADAEADPTAVVADPETDADSTESVADPDTEADSTEVAADPDTDAVTSESGTGSDADTDPSDDDAGSDTAPAAAAGDAPAAPQLSEAEAELAAQREFRAKIEKRKAEKAEISAGAKLSGRAADLMAAVRAVESGAKPAAAFVPKEPAPAPAPPRGPAAPVAAQAAVPSQAVSAPAAAAAPRAPGEPLATGAAAPETVSDVRGVLVSGGAPEALAGAVAGKLGEQAAELLRADPWQLLSVPGVRPEHADGFARALLGDSCGPGDGRRTAALVGWLLERAALKGHTAVTTEQVCTALTGHGVPDPAEAVAHAVAEGVALALQEDEEELDEAYEEAEGGDAEGGEKAGAAGPDESEPTPALLGLDRYAMAEESLAEGLARLVNYPVEDAGEWERLPGSAGELVRAVAGNGLVAHTGGEAARAEPAALLAAAHRLGLRAYATTHSADGRARVAAAIDAATGASDGATGPSDRDTGPSDGDNSPQHTPGSADTAVTPRPVSPWAATLAGLLSGAEGPGRDADGALALDLLVVLDAPQLDVETGAMLVEALPDGARLVLSGDPGVLASAGAGQVFVDVLSSRSCPQVASRTPDPGPIGELVSGIGIGELNQVEAPGKEVVIVPVRDAGEAVHRTVQLVADSVPRAFGVPPEDTQVITPGHGGSAGTRALNAALKQRLNPGPGRFGGFDAGDRIAYVPVPGRTVPGTVVGADAQGLRLDCAGTPVVVPKEQVEAQLRHAWALTAHQAAGMRWPAVVVVLPGDAAQGLDRPWVYTAFGRGVRHLSVVHGVDQALPRAVAESPARPRTTRLAELLRPAPAEAMA
ncbi:helix-hairpin-helix domain-containing protein [Streptomyces sp. NPDC051561]|uniref:helix-hairpin-helix domain-containing protein n=1 Tax=Streptomyces sp. NPDC051561 TaxID=3365658 RepID=UPI0037BBFAD0